MTGDSDNAGKYSSELESVWFHVNQISSIVMKPSVRITSFLDKFYQT